MFTAPVSGSTKPGRSCGRNRVGTCASRLSGSATRRFSQPMRPPCWCVLSTIRSVGCFSRYSVQALAGSPPSVTTFFTPTPRRISPSMSSAPAISPQRASVARTPGSSLQFMSSSSATCMMVSRERVTVAMRRACRKAVVLPGLRSVGWKSCSIGRCSMMGKFAIGTQEGAGAPTKKATLCRWPFVENTGVEPVTSCMPCKRSSQLS